MYGFRDTKCKIDGCDSMVWPNRILGYCNKHYQRNKTSRMDDKGNLLPFKQKEKECEACGAVFMPDIMARNVRWCEGCRKDQYAIIVINNNRGIYVRKSKRRKKIMKVTVSAIVSLLDKMEKWEPAVKARKQGKTYREIGKEMGYSASYIQQNCKQPRAKK